MSRAELQVLVAAGLALAAALAAWRLRLELGRTLLVTAARATGQLFAVGLLLAAVFAVPPLATAFIAVMLGAAAFTAGGRLPGVPRARARAALAIGMPALGATGLLLATGAFAFEPRSAIPAAGILIGGAMAATSLTGRRLLEGLEHDEGAIEARLALGDPIRTALAPTIRRAVQTGMVPVVDQTRTVGLVALPGTFVGLLLGGASPGEAARLQLTVLLSLLAVELAASVIVAELAVRTRIATGDRLLPPPA